MPPRTVRTRVGGVALHAELWLPRDLPAPVLLMRTPYGAADAQRSLYAAPAWYAERGYAVMVQDVRGRGASGGRFDPFRREAADGAATIRWIAAQRWCDGRVGMYGMSYPGATQLLAASARPPALRAIAPAMTASDLAADWFHDGGAPSLSLVLLWAAVLGVDTARRAGDEASALALEALCAAPEELYGRWGAVPAGELLGPAQRHVPYLSDWVEHPVDDPFWATIAPPGLPRLIDLPALHVGGWFDVLLGGTLRTYAALHDRGEAPQHLLVGPWAHEPWSRLVGDRDLGPAAESRVDEAQLEWFGHWLRGTPLEAPPVRVFELGSGRWREEDAWPPPKARRVRLHLQGPGTAAPGERAGRLLRHLPPDEPPDELVHDPRAPVPTIGGRGCSVTNGRIVGPRDRRGLERRPDVLAYETDVLTDGCTIAGEVRCELHVALSDRTADVVACLCHVEPDGRVTGLTDGIVRLTADRPDPGGERHPARGVLRTAFSIGHTCAAIARGDRLRIEIASSSHPRWARDRGRLAAAAGTPGTGAPTIQRVFHDPGRPSWVELPIVHGGILA